MGGKTTQSTQGVTIPPAVLAQYQNVNQKANTTAANPFQQYGGQFVAPVNAQQNTGIAATNAAAGQAQPYFGAATGAITGAQAGVNPINQAATGLMGQSAEQVNPTNLDAASIDKYLSPYLNTVLGSTESLINQQNQQAQAGQMGTAIQSGAFGGDRSGIAAANLSQQQELAAGNIYSGIANQGYQSALGTAQQQQGVNLAAGQANRAALANAATGLAGIGQTAYGEGANTATTLAGLGTGAQGAALQGAQAQIGAGTLQQQTQQAQDTAQYNQFLQQQSYPFQVDQFLANIAEGTGALSGSTTTTTQPGGFFSDRRLKHDIKKIGKTYDGQHIYSYKMHGDDRTHIGLIAQDVEKKHPEATGVSGHYKVVDYGKATEDAANRGHFYSGGVVPIRAAYAGGGNPMPQYAGMPSAVSPMDLSAILQAQQAMYAPYSGGKGLYGNEGGGPYGGVGHVPPPSGAVSHLVTPQGGLSRQPSVLENTKAITDLVNSGQKIYSDAHRQPSGGQGGGVGDNSFSQNVVDQQGGLVPGPQISDTPITTDVQVPGQWRGGRTGLAQGGMPYSEDPNYTELNIPDTTNSQQLKTAGPLPQQKSGLQNLVSLVGDAATLYGGYAAGVAAAAAAKRGGRIGYADGGAPDDTQLDPIEVDSSAPPPVTSGLAPNTDAPPTPDVQRPADIPMRTAGLAPPDDGGDKRHWYSKAENIVPLLTGLAAMGTAPTRHLGVALSAGLGAGAQTWLPSQEAAADIQHQQLQNVGTGLQNTLTQYQLNQILHPPATDTAKATPTPGMKALGSSVDPTSVRATAQQVGQIPNTYTSNEAAAIQQASMLQKAGKPNNLQALLTQHQTRMQTNQQNAAFAMNAAYQDADLVANAGKGNYYATLLRVHPEAAANIQAIAARTGISTDDLAYAYADQVGGATHQYSGRAVPKVGNDGKYRDQETGHLLLGGAVPEGASPDTLVHARLALATPTDTGAARRPPLGSTSAGADAANALGLVPGNGARTTTPTGLAPTAPPTAPAPTRKAASPIPARQPMPAQSLAHPNSSAAAPGSYAPGVLPPSNAADRQTIQGKPIEPEYQLGPMPSINDPQTPEQVAAWGAINKKREELTGDAGALTTSATMGLTFTKAAEALINSHGNVAGLGAEAKATVSRALQAAHITSGADATNYQELAKQLGNIAVQNFKDNFGARPAAKEFDIQMNQLNPNEEMTPDAIRNLLRFNEKNFNYAIQTGSRASEYAVKNGNPNNFYKWNNTHFDRSGYVNQGEAPARALADLRANPKLAPQFQAKYGYLP